MSILEAVFLGIVQGITEFVPVSSSGHLVLVPSLFNMNVGDLDFLNLVAVTHVGTLVAVVVYFWRDLWQIAVAVLEGLRQRRPLINDQARLGWYIVVGTIPAGVLGLLFKDMLSDLFERPVPAAFFLFGTAGLLILGERLLRGDKKPREMSWTDAFIIGCFQALALFPGISRSGSAIVGGLWRGLDRATAARYSFLLSVPVTAAAGFLEVAAIRHIDNLSETLPILVVATVVAGLVGIVSIHFLLEWLRKRSLYTFAIYCASLATIFLLVTVVRGV